MSNLARVDALRALAAARGASPAQVALAWLLSRGPDIVPIVGMERRAMVDENLRAADLTLSASELDELERIFEIGSAAGSRYPDGFSASPTPG